MLLTTYLPDGTANEKGALRTWPHRPILRSPKTEKWKLFQPGISRIEKMELDVQITTAKAYPRSITEFRRTATEMATLDVETASKCFYILKRHDKDGSTVKIEGPSVRFAEIAVCSWGNIRGEMRIADTDERFVYGQGAVHDLQSNVAVRVEVARRITNKSGRRYNDDMIQTTGNAASSIAYRNAALKVIPRAVWFDIYEKARQTARGDAKTLISRRDKMLEEFKKLKVSAQMIYEFLEVKGLDDIGLDELLDLTGTFNAINNGDTTVDDAFGKPEVKQPQRTTTESAAGTTTTATGAKQEEAKPKAAERPAGEKPITPEEVQAVYAAGYELTWDLPSIKKYVKRHYGVDSVAELSRERYAHLLQGIKDGGLPDLPPEEKK